MQKEQQINIDHIAKLANLKLDDSEKTEFATQISDILAYMEKLNSLDVSNLEPTSHAVSVYDVMREDQVDESRTLSHDSALSNAVEHNDDCFLVPRVIE